MSVEWWFVVVGLLGKVRSAEIATHNNSGILEMGMESFKQNHATYY